MVFWNVIFPVFLIIALGYIIQKKVNLNIQSFSTPVLHIMVPALIFTTFYDAHVDSTYLYILAYGISLTVLLLIVAKIFSVFLKLNTEERSAFQISTIFMNTGNYGLPVVLFAFGEVALGYALTITVIQMLFMSTLGLYLAARSRHSLRTALFRVIKMPLVHAVALAFVLGHPAMPPLPENIVNTLTLLSGGAIPAMILVLGMQLADISPGQLGLKKVSSALATRLLISPVLALCIASILPVSELLLKVMIIQAAMPPAAIITIYAIEYDCQPKFVSTVTLFGTVLSAGTITGILALM